MLILTYHSIDESGSVISTAPSTFKQQMLFLKRSGHRCISLRELCRAWEAGEDNLSRSVVLTFDDGYANFKLHAVPVLESCGFSATVFIVAGHAGAYNNWPGQLPIVPHLPLLGWGDLRQLAREGFEIGGHSLTHQALSGASKDALDREVRVSKDIIGQRIGCPVESFAYPYGIADRVASDCVSAHYRAACTTEMGEVGPADPRHLLKRIDSYYLRRLVLFRSIDSALGRSYLSVRKLGRNFGARWKKWNRLSLAEVM